MSDLEDSTKSAFEQLSESDKRHVKRIVELREQNNEFSEDCTSEEARLEDTARLYVAQILAFAEVVQEEGFKIVGEVVGVSRLYDGEIKILTAYGTLLQLGAPETEGEHVAQRLISMVRLHSRGTTLDKDGEYCTIRGFVGDHQIKLSAATGTYISSPIRGFAISEEGLGRIQAEELRRMQCKTVDTIRDRSATLRNTIANDPGTVGNIYHTKN